MQRSLVSAFSRLPNCVVEEDFAVLRDGANNKKDSVSSVCELPCLSNPCSNGATCISLLSGNYLCMCFGGFTGSACEIGQSIRSSVFLVRISLSLFVLLFVVRFMKLRYDQARIQQ